MKKIIIAQLNILENKRELFLNLAETMITKTRAEVGCITYRLLIDHNQKNDFIFYEEYKSEEAIELHNTSEHFKLFFNAVVPLLGKEPTIENY